MEQDIGQQERGEGGGADGKAKGTGQGWRPIVPNRVALASVAYLIILKALARRPPARYFAGASRHYAKLELSTAFTRLTPRQAEA